MSAPKSFRLPWLSTVAVAVGLAVLLSLGAWQVRRLEWKTGLIAAAETAATRPRVPLSEALADPVVEFRRVVAECPGLASAPYVELRSIEDGRPGVRLISACAVGTGGVLIDRGFVADEVSARPPVAAAAAVTVVQGELRGVPPPGPLTPPPANGQFYARDTAAMAQALGVTGEVAPVVLFATSSSNPDWPALEPSAPPAAFSNNHLGYALTWFGLALALAGFYIVSLVSRLKRSRS